MKYFENHIYSFHQKYTAIPHQFPLKLTNGVCLIASVDPIRTSRDDKLYTLIYMIPRFPWFNWTLTNDCIESGGRLSAIFICFLSSYFMRHLSSMTTTKLNAMWRVWNRELCSILMYSLLISSHILA